MRGNKDGHRLKLETSNDPTTKERRNNKIWGDN